MVPIAIRQTQTRFTFFGPRNLDYESLYNHIVTTLTRFVSAPPEDSCTGDNPWWKKPKVAKVNGTAAADASMEEKSQVRPINTLVLNLNKQFHVHCKSSQTKYHKHPESLVYPKLLMLIQIECSVLQTGER